MDYSQLHFQPRPEDGDTHMPREGTYTPIRRARASTPRVEAIIVQYGVANEEGDVLTHEAALKMLDQLRAQESTPPDWPAYYLVSVRIEGDEKSGQIVGAFEFL